MLELTINNTMDLNNLNNTNYMPAWIGAMERWIDGVPGTADTITTYANGIKRFAEYMNNNQIAQPTEDDVNSWIKALLAANYKPTTINSYLTSCKQFFKWTGKRGLYKDIAADVKPIGIDEEFRKDALTTEQCKQLLSVVNKDTIKGKRDFAILTLMLTTGLRTVEVARADVTDLRAAGEGLRLYVQGKGKHEKTQYVKVEPEVFEAISDYYDALKSIKGLPDDIGLALFKGLTPGSFGNRMTTRAISGMVKGYLKKANLESDRLTAHSLRHTAAVLNLLNGGTLEETQILLRHENSSTTKIYSHMIERMKNNSEARLAKLIFG